MELGYYALLPESLIPGPEPTGTFAAKLVAHLTQNSQLPLPLQVVDPDATEAAQLFRPDHAVVFEDFEAVWLPNLPNIAELWDSFRAQNPVYAGATLERDVVMHGTPIERTGHARPDAARRSRKKDQPEADVFWHVRMVMAEPLWPTGTGTGVNVGILDTGLDMNNPLLMAGFLEGVSFTGTTDCMDDEGHGTHITGIIASRPGVGPSGAPVHWSIAPGCSHYSVKVLDPGLDGETAWLVAGLNWLRKRSVHVVNMSLQLEYEMPKAVHRAIKKLSPSAVMVAAVGNRGPMLDSVCWPAKYTQVIGVGAVDKDKVIWDGSARSATDQSQPDENVDMVAPGSRVVSNDRAATTVSELSGTSMSAAVVSGLCALLREKDPALAGTTMFRARLKQSLEDLGKSGQDREYGRGLARFEG